MHGFFISKKGLHTKANTLIYLFGEADKLISWTILLEPKQERKNHSCTLVNKIKKVEC